MVMFVMSDLPQEWERGQILRVSADVDMNVESQEKDGIEGEEDESVNEDGFAVGLHASELKLLAVAGEGAEKPGLEQHEQHYADEYWCPIRHCLFHRSLLFSLKRNATMAVAAFGESTRDFEKEHMWVPHVWSPH